MTLTSFVLDVASLEIVAGMIIAVMGLMWGVNKAVEMLKKS